MKNVKVEPGCISCGSCQFIVPEVFEVTDTSHVKYPVDFKKFEALIREAAAKCPVQVIKIEE
jgi:ferredoxin